MHLVCLLPFVDEVSNRICSNQGQVGYNLKFHGFSGIFVLSVNNTLNSFAGGEWFAYQSIYDALPFSFGKNDFYECFDE